MTEYHDNQRIPHAAKHNTADHALLGGTGAVCTTTNILRNGPDLESRCSSPKKEHEEAVRSKQSLEALSIARELARLRNDVDELRREHVATQRELQKLRASTCNRKHQEHVLQGHDSQNNLQLEAVKEHKHAFTDAFSKTKKDLLEKMQLLEDEFAQYIVSRVHFEKTFQDAQAKEAELQQLLLFASPGKDLNTCKAYALDDGDIDEDKQNEDNKKDLEFTYEGLDVCKGMSIDHFLDLVQHSTTSKSHTDNLDNEAVEGNNLLAWGNHMSAGSSVDFVKAAQHETPLHALEFGHVQTHCRSGRSENADGDPRIALAVIENASCRQTIDIDGYNECVQRRQHDLDHLSIDQGRARGIGSVGGA